jgi:hypothetical protein
MKAPNAIATFTEALGPEIRRRGHMSTEAMYRHVQRTLPNLCDDRQRCVHKGRDYQQPEWKHQVRNAQQNLKRAGKILLGGEDWHWRGKP